MFFDTETTGLPKYKDPAYKGPGNWPHLVSIAWIVKSPFKREYFIIKPEWDIPEESIKVHGITREKAEQGHDLSYVMSKFLKDARGQTLVAHNMNFDYNVIVNACMWDLQWSQPRFNKMICTMELTKPILKIPGLYGFKYPKLAEVYKYFFYTEPEGTHNSLRDTELLFEICQKLHLDLTDTVQANEDKKGVLRL
jgi:DNA polymerase III epsilon subunit-like protein